MRTAMITNCIQPHVIDFVQGPDLVDFEYRGISSLPVPCCIVKIVNETDVTLLFSTDGHTDHFVIAPNSYFIIDAQQNSQTPNEMSFFAQGTVFYSKTFPGEIANGAVLGVKYSQYRN